VHASQRRTRIAAAAIAAAAAAVAAGLAPGAAQAASPGPYNAITDVPGVEVGHRTSRHAATGTTAIIMPRGAIMGAAPSGGAPGNRVTTILQGTFQEAMLTRIYGVLLNGGSIFGLDAACGVVKYLQQRGLGISFGGQTVPLVPGSIIFDLGRGADARNGRRDQLPNTCAWGYRAARAAHGGRVAQGSVGAGTGARSGGVKGGVGTASLKMPDGTTVGALVVVNSSGRPYNVDNGCGLNTSWLELGNEFGALRRPRRGCRTDPAARSSQGDENTTIGIVATDAALMPGQAQRLAQVADDGYTRAIRPAHTPFDGDTTYAASTAAEPKLMPDVQFSALGAAAADVYSRAIMHAILAARSLGVAPTYCRQFAGACGR
jgi:L-aminopeptidase/D-esterase-like protein